MILNILFLLIVLAYAQEDMLSLESVNLDYDEDYYDASPINAEYSPHN